MRTYIKEVILENFLSYDYARIPLFKGINLITGPNGSGKSSILLGISVALGQTYTERGRRLSDLINYNKDVARVSIILDNTPQENKRPFPFSKLDQVMISRIIRKDGNYWFEFNQEVIDKYQLQRSLKRLGIDPDNMLIIMHQNMIERFVALDPRERLIYFEEVLGILNFRKNIQGAISKLEEIEKSRKSIEEALKNAETNLNYWKKMYEKYERKIELNKKLNKLKNELFWCKYNGTLNEIDKKKLELNKLNNNKEKLTNEIFYLNNLMDKNRKKFDLIKEKLEKNDINYDLIKELFLEIENYSNYKSEKVLKEFKLELINEEINKINNDLNILLNLLKDLEKKKPSEYFEPRSDLKEIEDEIKLIQFEIKNMGEITDEIPQKYIEYKNIYDEINLKSSEINENKNKLLNELNERIKAWKNNLIKILEDVNKEFSKILEYIEGVGNIEIHNIDDINNASLEIKVGFRENIARVLDSYSQSGGERTLATLAFLLSLQKYMKSPIRAIDEFDTHMDPLNKERATKLITSIVQNDPNLQYIIITPDPLLEFFNECNIIIVTKQQGISKVGKLK
ncbi:MAG: AAA family ATPase [Thermoproteota archaeon]|nr:AAA family ATPase [Thermoproteota archaeon]